MKYNGVPQLDSKAKKGVAVFLKKPQPLIGI